MKFKTILALLIMSPALAIMPASINAQNIIFNSGGADLTFFYDSSDEGSFDVVFRNKGNTNADGLTNPYPGPPGGVGAGDDYQYDSLLVQTSGLPSRELNGVNYFVTPADGAGAGFELEDFPDQPDFGVRTRFRELDNGDVIDQFESFTLTLNWDASDKPAGAEFAMWNFTGDAGQLEVLYETLASDFSHDWPAWGHTHWHWGFTEVGDYTLAFDFAGNLPGGGQTDFGATSVDFVVVPEPRTVGLLAGLGAFGLVYLRRLRRNRS